jgi:putative secretion ATPase (PEP-CTERM system associated)
MYEAFFNLRMKPFELVPDPRFMFLSRSHKKALTYLDYGIREKAGFILLTGDVGSGKTTLLRNLLNTHNEKIVLAKLFNTSVNSDQLLAMINDDFGLITQGKDKISLLRDLNEFLVQQFAAGRQPVLIIDEAQNLSSELLEEVRMLSNLETSDSKLLQIILAGQPELRMVLASPELLQLRQRISINCNLSALSRPETEQYIRHRLEVAGNVEAAFFEPETFDIIHRYSHGIPRLINIICDFLFLSAFAEEATIITVDMAHEVIADMDFENHFWAVSHPVGTQPEIDQPNSIQPEIMPLQQQGLQDLLSAILRRVDSIELDIRNSGTDSSEHAGDLARLYNAIESNRAYTDAHLQELGAKLEGVVQRVEHAPAMVEQYETPKSGIVRRLFGINQDK